MKKLSELTPLEYMKLFKKHLDKLDKKRSKVD